jgi:hypothetical protein
MTSIPSWAWWPSVRSTSPPAALRGVISGARPGRMGPAPGHVAAARGAFAAPGPTRAETMLT